jgi:hypothetical protein
LSEVGKRAIHFVLVDVVVSAKGWHHSQAENAVTEFALSSTMQTIGNSDESGHALIFTESQGVPRGRSQLDQFPLA